MNENTATPAKPISRILSERIANPTNAATRKALTTSHGLRISHSNNESIRAAVVCSGRSAEPCPATSTLNTNSIKTMMKAPTTIPRLFDVPPIMNAAQTKKVERAGDMKLGSNPVSFQAQNAPARAAIEAPRARLAAL